MIAYAAMGAVIGLVMLGPLGLPGYGLTLGALLGVQARLTLDGAPDPDGWTAEHAADSTYRRGAAAIAAMQVVATMVLAMVGAALMGGG